MHCISLSTLSRDLTTARSVSILRMVPIAWKNVLMAYRGPTASFSNTLMRIVSVIHVIQTAPKGKRKFCEVSHPIYCLEYMKIYMQFGLVKHLSHS